MCTFFRALDTLDSAGVMEPKSPESVTHLRYIPHHDRGLERESRYRGPIGASFHCHTPSRHPPTCSPGPQGPQLILHFISALPGLLCPIKLNLLLFSVQLRDCNSTQRATHWKCEQCRTGKGPQGAPREGQKRVPVKVSQSLLLNHHGTHLWAKGSLPYPQFLHL